MATTDQSVAAPDESQLEAGRGNTDTNAGDALEKPSSSTGTMVDEPTDPNVVDWDGPDDPEHPLNWSKTRKNLHLVIVSLFTLAA